MSRLVPRDGEWLVEQGLRSEVALARANEASARQNGEGEPVTGLW
jgi:hypothetical protein